MMVLVSYDVATTSSEGRRRLRKMAKTCQNYGQRVQNSVFECVLDPTFWTRFRLELLKVHEPKEDSLRFYFMGANWKHRVEHHGAKPALDVDDPLIV